MKKIFLILFTAIMPPLVAQVHRIGIDSGVNTIASWNGDTPLGLGSPFDAQLGFSTNLSYTFFLSNNITINLRNGLNFLKFQSDNEIVFVGNQNIKADLILKQHIYHTSIGGGYLFRLNEKFSIDTEVGVSMLFYYKQSSFFTVNPESRIEKSVPWRNENRYHGVYLAMNNNYLIHRSRNYGLFLTGSIRATQVFDYLKISQNLNRVIPELNLGLAVVFGNYWYSRF